MQLPSRRFLPGSLVLALLFACVPGGRGQADKAQPPPLTAKQKERLTERDQLVADVRKLQAAGKTADAVASLLKVLAIEREVFGEAHREVIDTLRWLANLYEQQEDFPAARKMREDVVALRTKLLGESLWEVTDARLELADLDRRAKWGPKQRERLKEADQLLDRLRSLHKEAKYREMLPPATQNLAIRRELFGEEHSAAVNAMMWIARAHLDLREYAEAAKVYRQSLAIRQKVLGADHPDCALVLNQLAVIEYRLGHVAESAQLHRQAVELRTKALGNDHADTRHSLNELAFTLRELAMARLNASDFPAARAACTESIEVRIKLRGKDHWEVTDARLDLAHIERVSQHDANQRKRLGEALELTTQAGRLQKEGKLRDALAAAEKVPPIAREVLGEQHRYTAAAYLRIARLQFELRDYPEAEKTCRQCLALCQKLYGPLHPEVAVVSNELGGVLTVEKRFGDAAAMHRQAVDIQSKLFGDADERTRSSLGMLADCLDVQAGGRLAAEDFKAAREARQELLAVRRRLYGEKHWRTTNARLALNSTEALAKLTAEQRKQLADADKLMDKVRALDKDKKYKEALDLVEQVRKVRRQMLGESNMPYIETVGWVGWLLMAQGDYARAGPLVKSRVELVRQLVGEMHPEYPSGLSDLADLFYRTKDYASSVANYRTAWKLDQQLYGPKHKDTLAALDVLLGALRGLAESQEKAEDYAAARQTRQEILDCRIQLYGPAHSRIVDARLELDHVDRLAKLTPEQRKSLLEAERLQAQAIELNDKKNYKDALPLAEQARSIRQQVMGEKHFLTVGSIGWVAWLHYNLNEAEQAETFYRQYVELTRQVLGETHPDHAYALFWLGNAGVKRGQFTEAVGNFRKSAALRKQLFGEKHKDYEQSVVALIDALQKQAGQLEARDDCPAARKSLEEVLALQSAAHKPDSYEVKQAREAIERMDSLANLEPDKRRQLAEARRLAVQAQTLRNEKKYSEALEARLRVLEIRREVLGEKHADTRAADSNLWNEFYDLERLAEKQEKQGAFDDARQTRQALLSARTRQHGAKHWQTINARWALTTVDLLAKLSPQQRQELEKTENVLKNDRFSSLPQRQEALQARRRLLGEEHPAMAAGYLSVAQKIEKPEDARPFVEKAYALDKKLLGADHPQTEEALFELGSLTAVGLAIDTGPRANLTPQQRKRLEERDRIYQEEYRYLRNIRDKREQTIAALEKMLAIEREVYGNVNDEVAASLELLAQLKEYRWDLQAARKLRQEVVAIKTKLYGANHWQTVEARFYVSWVDRLGALSSDQSRALFARPPTPRGEKMWEQARVLLPEAEKSREVVRSLLGENHLYYANSLDGLAQMYSLTGDDNRAEAYYLRAAEITGKILGPDHPVYRNRLASIASRYANQARSLEQYGGDLAQARKLLEKRIPVIARLNGANHWSVLDARQELALTDFMAPLSKQDRTGLRMTSVDFDPNTSANEYRCQEAIKHGDFPLALKDAQEMLDVQGRFLGDKHPATARGLNAMGQVLKAKGDYAAALPYFRRALDIRKRHLGEGHPAYADSLNNLGVTLYLLGCYVEAEPVLQEARRCLERIDKNHPFYASSLSNIAMLRVALGDYQSAEPLLNEALSICRRWTADPNTDPTSDPLSVSGRYQTLMGEFSLASLLRDYTISVPIPRPKDDMPDEAYYLNNLAAVCQAQREYGRAELMFREALGIVLRASGKDKERIPAFLACVDNMGALYRDMNEYGKAEQLLSFVVHERKGGTNGAHPLYATALNNLGFVYFDKGDLDRAERFWTEAHDVRRQTLGKGHPNTLITLANLALLAEVRKDPKLAVARLGEVVTLSRSNLELTSAIQSERQQLITIQQLRGYLDYHLSLAERIGRSGDDTYPFVLTWKGNVFVQQRRMRQLRRLAQSGAQPELAKMFAELENVTQRLAALAFSGAEGQSVLGPDVEKLTLRKEELERELSSRSAEFRGALALDRIGIADLQKLLSKDTALVDFIEYSRLTPSTDPKVRDSRERRLAAFVVRSEGPVVRLDLGPMAPIAEAVERWRRTYGIKRSSDVDPAADLRRLVWLPLEPSLKGIRNVLVSPDGALARFPLPALPGAKPDSFLIEELTIAVVPVPQLLREILSARPATQKSSASLLLLGDVDFDAKLAATGPASADSAAPRPPQSVLGEGRFGALPGTGKEIEALRELFASAYKEQPVADLRGATATDADFRKQVAGKRYVHLATHGFFAPPSMRSAMGVARDGSAGEQNLWGGGGIGWNPGILSGVIFAGVNNRSERNPSAGILTALEVAELDLNSADLVVLSACETGLGETAGGEGVFGLQRAFELAGARSVVASLWKVDDRATQQMMEQFYKNLWEKKLGPAESLRQAQIFLLRMDAATSEGRGFEVVKEEVKAGTKVRVHPRLWAAWVLSGDPGLPPPVSQPKPSQPSPSVAAPSQPSPSTAPEVIAVPSTSPAVSEKPAPEPLVNPPEENPSIWPTVLLTIGGVLGGLGAGAFLLRKRRPAALANVSPSPASDREPATEENETGPSVASEGPAE